MSNLSQFFALGGGNKIKSIQTVTATQTETGGSIKTYSWSGVTASISAVDTSKTLLICSPSNNFYIRRENSYSNIATVINTGHGAYLYSSTEVRFHGNSVTVGSIGSPPNPDNIDGDGAYMVVQVVEFE